MGYVAVPVIEREGDFVPVAWYYPTGSSPGVPCRWVGILNGEVIIIVATEA